MYLEEYFEEQLKELYPDRIFPGGREEQMIPPLEDEIEDDDDEEETSAEGATQCMPQGVVEGLAATEKQETPSPATDKGLPQVKEINAAVECEAEKEVEKETTTIDRGTDIVVKSEGDVPPTVTIKDCQTSLEPAPGDSAVSPGEGKDAEELIPAKEENLPFSTHSPAVPPEAQQEEEEKEAQELVAEEGLT